MRKIRTFLMVTAMVAVASLWGMVTPERASAFTMFFEYSGASDNVTVKNSATASGYITFADSLPNSPTNSTATYDKSNGTFGSILALSITVKGATGGVGDGTFTAANYSKFFWDSGGGSVKMFSAPDNMMDQFVEYSFNGSDFAYTFGDPDGGGGDFGLWKSGGNAPTYHDYFMLTTAAGDEMYLVSLTTTPEPGTLLLLCVGLIGFALFRMRKMDGEGGLVAA